MKNGIKGAMCAGSLLLTVNAFATSTGLNNIPTVDTPPDRTLVIQAFDNLGDDRRPDYVAGFKMGLRPWGQRFEWGLDGRLGSGDEGPAVFQVKYAVQPWEKLPTVALGAANIAVTEDDRRRAGQAFKFPVLTQDFQWLRAHAGFGFQRDNNAAFFGLDKTLKVLERDLMLRSDVIQIQDQQQWMGSAGFIYFVHQNFAVESWVSQPFDHGKSVFTNKLNLIWKF